MYPDLNAPVPETNPSFNQAPNQPITEMGNNPHPTAPPQQNPQPNAPQTTYVYVNADNFQWGPRPMNVYCPHCHQQVQSKIKYCAGLLTWLLFGGCLLFGCWAGCCLIPFCMDKCQNCEHYCSNCKAFLGQYKRL